MVAKPILEPAKASFSDADIRSDMTQKANKPKRMKRTSIETLQEKDWDTRFVGKMVRIVRGEHRNREGIVLCRRIGNDPKAQYLVGNVFVDNPQKAVPVGVMEMELVH